LCVYSNQLSSDSNTVCHYNYMSVIRQNWYASLALQLVNHSFIAIGGSLISQLGTPELAACWSPVTRHSHSFTDNRVSHQNNYFLWSVSPSKKTIHLLSVLFIHKIVLANWKNYEKTKTCWDEVEINVVKHNSSPYH